MTQQIIPVSLAERNRNTNAVNLAARHLADRSAKHITARQAGGLLVWTVESQTHPGTSYTVTRVADGWPADTCSCEDHAYRHMSCKHQKAVDLLNTPVAEFTPVGGFLSQQKRARVEWSEEV